MDALSDAQVLAWHHAARGLVLGRRLSPDLSDDVLQEMVLCLLEAPDLETHLWMAYLRARVRLQLRVRWQHQQVRRWVRPALLLRRLSRAMRDRTQRQARWTARAASLDNAVDLRRLIGQMPPRQQDGCWRMLLEGWTMRQVARAEGVTPAAIHWRLRHLLGARPVRSRGGDDGNTRL